MAIIHKNDIFAQNASKPEEMEISYAPPYEIPRSVHESSSEVHGQN